MSLFKKIFFFQAVKDNFFLNSIEAEEFRYLEGSVFDCLIGVQREEFDHSTI